MNATTTDRLKMMTFQPMVDSETTRLLGHYYDLDLDERDHLFGWVSILTLFRGGYGLIPLVYGKGIALTGPARLAAHFDAALPADRRLVPPDPPLADQVAADWKSYNGGMGADVAIFSYFHLLPRRDLMAPIFAAPVPQHEARLVPAVYGLLSGLFKLLLRLSSERAAAAADRMRRAFEDTDRRIADGRHYLCGDRLTLGDIALCAASAPLLQPRGYGALMPPVESLPPAMRALAEELGAHPTGAFVQRLYDGGFAGG